MHLTRLQACNTQPRTIPDSVTVTEEEGGKQHAKHILSNKVQLLKEKKDALHPNVSANFTAAQ